MSVSCMFIVQEVNKIFKKTTTRRSPKKTIMTWDSLPCNRGKRQKAIIRFAAGFIICASNFQQIFEGYIKYTLSNMSLQPFFLYFTYVAIYLQFELSWIIAARYFKKFVRYFFIYIYIIALPVKM